MEQYASLTAEALAYAKAKSRYGLVRGARSFGPSRGGRRLTLDSVFPFHKPGSDINEQLDWASDKLVRGGTRRLVRIVCQ